MFPLPTAGLETEEARAQTFARVLASVKPATIKTAEDAWEFAMTVLCLDPALGAIADEFDPEDVRCRVFGHACPVFFARSYGTETRAHRKSGRYVATSIKLKVARRDNYTCQLCRASLDDLHIEFDHIIPLAQGGATTVANLRVLCVACNRRRSANLDPDFLAP